MALQSERMPLGLVRQNIQYLGRLLSLSSQEQSMVEGSVLLRKNQYFHSFINECFNEESLCPGRLAAMAGIKTEDAEALLMEKSPLLQFGILEKWRSFCNEYTLSHRIWEFLKGKYVEEKELRNALLGEPVKGTLRAADFNYIKETDLAVKLVKNAKGITGLNILLYGEPGTGKTSFAQMLAASARRDLYPVGEEDSGERGRNYRLQALHRKLELLTREAKSVLLFDEAEDLFSSRMTVCDKVEISRLLENNRSPVIWTTNNIHHMDPAFVRRFTLAVYFEQPPVEVRRKIWRQNLKKYHLPCSVSQINALAKEFPVPPSMISGAARAASIVKGDLATVRQHLHVMGQAMHGGQKVSKDNAKKTHFNPLLVQTDMDLNALTQRLKGLEHRNFSLCLYGVSGTGKSAYARYLAEELGLQIIQQRASDLISPFVGATEQRIARAFAQAKEQQCVLVFDEADSFLQDRARASHSWEISAVNEMLTWMEEHTYPFICTTNLMDSLDPACLRRFSFKVRYDFLTAVQVERAFRYFFDMSISGQEALTLPRVTPGDFAVVKNKADILGVGRKREELLRLLQQEQSLKIKYTESRIGFCK